MTDLRMSWDVLEAYSSVHERGTALTIRGERITSLVQQANSL